MIFGAATVTKEKVRLLGGQNEKHLWTHDLFLHTVESTSFKSEHVHVLKYKFDGHALITIDDVMYVFGGSSNRKQSHFVIYSEKDLNLTPVETKGDVPIARREFGLTRHKNNVYIFGGKTLDKNPTYLNDFYCLNWETMTWSKLDQNVISPRSGLSLVSDNNKMYLFGGKCVADNKIRYDSHLYAMDSDSTWTNIKTTGDAPIARESLQMVYANDKIYCYGGWLCKSKTDSTLYSLDINKLEWKKVADVSGEARFGHCMVFLNDALVILGGVDESWKFVDAVVHKLEKKKLDVVVKPKQVKKKPTKPKIGDLMKGIESNPIDLPSNDKFQELEKNSQIKEEPKEESPAPKKMVGGPMMGINPFGGFVPKKKD